MTTIADFVPTEEIAKQIRIFLAIDELHDIAFASGINKDKFVKNKKPNKYSRDPEKEFDDAISAYMSNIETSAEILDQLKTTLSKYFGKVDPVCIFERAENIQLGDGHITVRSFGTRDFANYAIYYPGIKLTKYSDRLRYLLKNDIEMKSAILIILTYYNMRSHSGTNWSPAESYPNLFEPKYRKHVKFECFASLFNNQNFLSNTKIIDHVFTLNPCDDVVGYVEGRWPVDTIRVLERYRETDRKFLLLVNPVYTERVILDSIDSLYWIWKEYPGRVSSMLTLPFWEDMYEPQTDLRKKMDEMGAVWKVYMNSTVRNFTQKQNVGLRFFQVTIN